MSEIGPIFYSRTFPFGTFGLPQTILQPAFCYFLTHKSRGGRLQSSADGNTYVKVRLSGAASVIIINVSLQDEQCPTQKKSINQKKKMSCWTLLIMSWTAAFPSMWQKQLTD